MDFRMSATRPALYGSSQRQMRRQHPKGGREFGRIFKSLGLRKRKRPGRNSTCSGRPWRSRYGSTHRCHQPSSVRFAGRSITTSCAHVWVHALINHGSMLENGGLQYTRSLSQDVVSPSSRGVRYRGSLALSGEAATSIEKWKRRCSCAKSDGGSARSSTLLSASVRLRHCCG